MTAQTTPDVTVTYQESQHAYQVKVSGIPVANIPVAYLVGKNAPISYGDEKSLNAFADTLRPHFEDSYSRVNTKNVLEKHLGFTSMSFKDYNSENGRKQQHEFLDTFAHLSLTAAFTRRNELAIESALASLKPTARPAPTQSLALTA